jgi:HSP20 family protein
MPVPERLLHRSSKHSCDMTLRQSRAFAARRGTDLSTGRGVIMALPMRVERRQQQMDPFQIVRNDLDMLNRFFGGSLFGDMGEDTPAIASSNYAVDIREDADHIYVEADLPGVRKEDVDITLENGVLTIMAERREEITEAIAPEAGQPEQQTSAEASAGQQASEGRQAGQPIARQQAGGIQQSSQQRGDFLLHERRIQRFVRSFALPTDVDEQDVQARLENGVLRITLRKRQDAKPKHVPIQ